MIVSRPYTRLIAGALALIPVVYIGLTIMGMVRWYSPVPFWDMWGTYLYAYMAYLDGTWRNLFAQTNEHLVWISNVFYFLDIRFFGGRSLLLQTLNFLLAAGLWLTLALVARRFFSMRRELVLPVIFILAAPTFSWLQEPNFTWGYQTQFYLAYLLPLAGFACLAMAQEKTASPFWFPGAVFFGVASVGSMANGIFALPLMVTMALMQKAFRRAAFLAVLAVLLLAFWFQGYRFISHPVPELLDAAKFILIFFGLPFALTLGPGAGIAAGSLFVGASVAHAGRWFARSQAREPLVLGLVFMLAYLGVSALSMAMGRAAMEGVEFSLRYATPSFLGWSILALLTLHAFVENKAARAAFIAAGAAAAIALLPAQMKVMDDTGPRTVHEKMFGTLALKLQIADPETIDNVYPVDPDSLKFVMDTAADANRRGLSIMGDPALDAAARAIGTAAADDAYAPCAGHIDVVTQTADPRFARVVGWVYESEHSRVPAFAYLAGEHMIEGVAVAGRPRPDVAAAVDPRALRGGFAGFVRAGTAQDGLRILCRRVPGH